MYLCQIYTVSITDIILNAAIQRNVKVTGFNALLSGRNFKFVKIFLLGLISYILYIFHWLYFIDCLIDCNVKNYIFCLRKNSLMFDVKH